VSDVNEQPARAVERLNALLRVELAAVLACQHAGRSMDGRLGPGSSHFFDLAVGHQRNVAALQSCIRALGAVPAAEAGTWGTFALLRDAVSLQQLLEAEQRGLAEYEAALSTVDGDVRELLEHELMPRQRQHVATLSKILGALPAA
jgi:bacterioferritin (cytochrome b1)